MNPLVALLNAINNSLDEQMGAQKSMEGSVEAIASNMQNIYNIYDNPTSGILQEDINTINTDAAEVSSSPATSAAFNAANSQFTLDNTTMQTNTQSWNSVMSPQTSVLSQGVSSFSQEEQTEYQAIQTIQQSLGQALAQGA